MWNIGPHRSQDGCSWIGIWSQVCLTSFHCVFRTVHSMTGIHSASLSLPAGVQWPWQDVCTPPIFSRWCQGFRTSPRPGSDELWKNLLIQWSSFFGILEVDSSQVTFLGSPMAPQTLCLWKASFPLSGWMRILFFPPVLTCLDFLPTCKSYRRS